MKALRIWAIPVLLLLLLFAQSWRSARLIRAQRLLQLVELRTRALIQAGRIPRGPLLENLELLARAKRLDPADVAVRVAVGSELFLLGDHDRARVAYQAALALEPRPEIYLNIGKVWIADGDVERGRPKLVRAVRLDPSLLREIPDELRPAVLNALRRQNDAHRAQQNR